MVDFWFRDGRWWHLLIVGTALANTFVAGSVAAFAATQSERSEALVATGALLLIPIVWLAFGVRSLTDPRRGAVLILLVTLLVTVSMVLVPWTGFVQTLIYPLVWLVCVSARRSILVSIGIAFGIGAVSALYNGVEEIPDILPGQLFSVAATCGIGLSISYAWRVADERRELLERLTASQEHVQELSRLSGASVERERISRDLHDTLAQTLAGLAMLADRSAKEIGRMRDDETSAGAHLREALSAQEERADLIASLARDALAEARGLIAENAPVRSTDPAEATFADALRRLVDRFRRETGVLAEARIDLEAGVLERESEVVLLRCAQEALSNARRHAHATNVQLSVELGAANVVLNVADDGQGFEPEAEPTGFGLDSLRDRANAIGGGVDISSAPGRGTIVTVTIPARASAER
ncbi:sensor histidine kinase [Pseudoclavibacter sp. VKM Ac-2867]|uniref:sensor histidine kinase n=1 Tax=Pseudoclavibacter sp. VKM Ac-2867 TaxID=2783829 RepID=UPI00188B5C5B|nr:sensor histidine kinase [Pseudoclavibacter sp. VKM Ac-2867]MBF4460209.1 sensor histidine kinase [Pseudoclavibacter sp. VKM Ac-2867]